MELGDPPTDQKVGGSSPSERTKKPLVRRGVLGGGAPLGWGAGCFCNGFCNGLSRDLTVAGLEGRSGGGS